MSDEYHQLTQRSFGALRVEMMIGQPLLTDTICTMDCARRVARRAKTGE